MVSMIEAINDDQVNVPIEEILGVEVLATVIINFDNDNIDEYDEMVSTLYGKVSYNYAPKKLDLDLTNRTTSPARPFIEETQVLELKALLSHLCYEFLGANSSFSAIIAADFIESQVEEFLLVCQKFKRAIS